MQQHGGDSGSAPFRVSELRDRGGLYYGINQISGKAVTGDRRRLANGNGLILAQPGSGKSVAAKLELGSVLVNTDSNVIVIDPTAEYVPLAEAFHGSAISFDVRDDMHLNPLDIDYFDDDGNFLDWTDVRYGTADGKGVSVQDKMFFVRALIETCLRKKPTDRQLSAIEKSVVRMYKDNYEEQRRIFLPEEKSKSRWATPEYLVRREEEWTASSARRQLSREEIIREYSPVMGDFYQCLKEMAHDDELKELTDSLERFITGSLSIFNHHTNIAINTRMTVFNIKTIPKNLWTTAMFIMLENITGRIEANYAKGISTYLLIDEFHEILRSPATAEYTSRLWKKGRKLGGIYTGVTQNVSDLVKGMKSSATDDQTENIFSNSKFFLLLSQSTPDRKVLEENLPISPALFDMIENCEPGNGLLIFGNTVVPVNMRLRKESALYQMFNTNFFEKTKQIKEGREDI